MTPKQHCWADFEDGVTSVGTTMIAPSTDSEEDVTVDERKKDATTGVEPLPLAATPQSACFPCKPPGVWQQAPGTKGLSARELAARQRTLQSRAMFFQAPSAVSAAKPEASEEHQAQLAQRRVEQAKILDEAMLAAMKDLGVIRGARRQGGIRSSRAR